MNDKGGAFSRKGVILVVSGPSGTGKSTICSRIFREMPDVYFSVSCTTRAPRTGEINGKHYYFISQKEFDAKIAAGEFVEYASVHGNSYGTLRSELFDKTEKGRDVLLDIDVQGAMRIRKKAESDRELADSLEMIFIGPPSFEELEKRLRERGTEPENVVRKRLSTAGKELEAWKEYEYIIINRELDDAVKAMTGLINSLRLKTRRKKGDLFNAC